MPHLFPNLRTLRLDLRNSPGLVALSTVLIFLGLVFVGVLPSLLRNDALADEPTLREFTLTAEEIDWEIMAGTTVRAWTYNGQMPGPELRVTEGDRVRITLRNELPVGTSIHWHGVNLRPEMDGPVGLNQAAVEPGDTFVYEFIATPAGTRWYHSHADPTAQIALGLYGALIVEPQEPQRAYDREFTYVLNEWNGIWS